MSSCSVKRGSMEKISLNVTYESEEIVKAKELINRHWELMKALNENLEEMARCNVHPSVDIRKTDDAGTSSAVIVV